MKGALGETLPYDEIDSRGMAGDPGYSGMPGKLFMNIKNEKKNVSKHL